MAHGVYTNLDSKEGAVSGAKIISLVRRSRKLVITNDSGSNDLKYRFNTSEAYATLKPTESISLYFYSKEVHLSGNGDYRIWAFG